MTSAASGGRILTFYSYKGGTGRSMALANVAWILASAGHRVLMIDWDLEAPGLHRYFRPFLIDEDLASSEGLLDLVDRYATQAIRNQHKDAPTPEPNWHVEFADFSDFVLSINFPWFARGGRLDLLPAGRQGDAYAVKVNSFNWQNLYDRLGGGGFFEAVKAQASRDYDYVLIDSRTGVSDTAGICSVQMPDTLVICFTYNNQSIKGAASVAKTSEARRRDMVREVQSARSLLPSADVEDTPRPYRMFAVPMRVDPDDTDRLALRQAFARETFADVLSRAGISKLADYWALVEVPHRSFYAYEEVLSTFKDDPNDPKTLLSAFVRLTRYLTDGAVAEYRLTIAPDERQRILDRYASTPEAASRVSPSPARESAEQTLARLADVALATLTKEQERRALPVLGRLVRVYGRDEGGLLHPVHAAIGDFSSLERDVVAVFASHGILRVRTEGAGEGGLQVVSLEQPELLYAWPPLERYLAENQDFLVWRQQLRTYLSGWQRSGGDRDALLSGRILGEARFWQARRAEDLSSSEREFVNESEASASFASAHHDSMPERALVRRRLPVWPAAAVILATFVLGVSWYARVNTDRVSRIVTAARATTDPLERALLLMELAGEPTVDNGTVALALETHAQALPYAVLRGGAAASSKVHFTSDGEGLIAGYADGVVQTWHGSSFAIPERLLTNAGRVLSAMWDQSGRQMIVTGANGVAEVWATDNPVLRAKFPIVSSLPGGTLFKGAAVIAQTMLLDGDTRSQMLVSHRLDSAAGADGKTGSTTLLSLPGNVSALTFSAGDRVAFATPTTIEVVNFSGEKVATRSTRDASVALAFSPTDAYLGTLTEKEVVVWELTTLQQAQRTFPTSGLAMAFAVAPDGESVAIAYSDGSVRLMKASGEIATLVGATTAVTQDVTFSISGDFLATAGLDGNVRLWRIGPTVEATPTDWRTIAAVLRGRTTACLTSADRLRLLGEATEEADRAAAACVGTYGLRSLQSTRPPSTS